MAYTKKIRDKATKLAKNRSAEKVVDELHKTNYKETANLSPRTIRRWVKAKQKNTIAILNEENKFKKKEEHYKELAKIASSFLDGNLDRIPYDALDSNQMFQLDTGELLTRASLVSLLQDNIYRACDEYKRWLVFDCLAFHLEPEYLGGQELFPFIESKPVEFIKIIRTLSHNKVFKGICSACKDF